MMIGNRKNIVRFLMVGGTSTFIDFIIYMLLSIRIPVSLSKLFSMCCASIFSYIVNKKWTFESQEQTHFFMIVRYILAQCINIGTNVSINQIVFGICKNKVISFILATGCAMCANYLLQRLFVFRRTEGKDYED